MAWSFRRRVKIIPGVYMNFSTRGISTTIVVRGASVNFGQTGTFINASIPGTGLRYREKINDKHIDSKVPDASQMPEVADNIISADVDTVSSQDLAGIKAAIIDASAQKKELQRDIEKVKSAARLTRTKLFCCYLIGLPIFASHITKSIKNDIQRQIDVVKGLEIQYNNSCVNLDIEFDEELKASYQRVVSAFEKLIQSARIWDITRADGNDRVASRSAASILVNKKKVFFKIAQLPDIRSEYKGLFLENANGADMYIYPNFIVMRSHQGETGLIDFKDLIFHFNSTRFIETDTIPHDTEVVGQTWNKVNKNGSPDKRFKDNFQIPIVLYGEILLRTESGMNEAYQFSNNSACVEFSIAFADYQKKISQLPAI